MIYLLLTIGVFLAYRQLFKPFRSPLANPLLFSILTIIALILMFDINLLAYQQANKPFIWLLEPAVVALAIPLYQQMHLIRKHFTAIMVSCVVAVLLAISTGIGIAMLFKPSSDVLLSLIPKSVTSPIAMSIAQNNGGIASLAAAVVIAVGLFGALFGFSLFKFVGITDPKAQGLAMGAGAHAIGTAKALEVGEQQGAFSSLALVLCGILTALLAPFFVWLLTVQL